MANKIAQSQRITAEMRHAPPTEEVAGRAVSLMARYRLQPDDLSGGRYTGRIHSIKTQGVEALTALAYITGLAKPLSLSGRDVETLVRMSDSPFTVDWIGHTVEVRVVELDGQRSLQLFAPGAADFAGAALPMSRPPQRPLLTAATFIAILMVAALLVLLAEQGAALWSLLEELIAPFSVQ